MLLMRKIPAKLAAAAKFIGERDRVFLAHETDGVALVKAHAHIVLRLRCLTAASRKIGKWLGALHA